MNRLHSVFAGARETLRFSNGALLLMQRLLLPRLRFALYVWKQDWYLLCDVQKGDHGSAKEVLAAGDYDQHILSSMRNDTLSYVNVGANVGAFDVAAASLARGGTSGLSIELNPETYGRLQFNLTMNKLSNVAAVNAGIGGSPRVIPFSPGKNSLEDNLYAKAESGAPLSQMPVLTLADTLDEFGQEAEHFDLLKLDCEGAEYEIVANTAAEVFRRFSVIVVEVHKCPAGQSVEALSEKIEAAGFSSEGRRRNDSGAQLLAWRRAVPE